MCLHDVRRVFQTSEAPDGPYRMVVPDLRGAGDGRWRRTGAGGARTSGERHPILGGSILQPARAGADPLHGLAGDREPTARRSRAGSARAENRGEHESRPEDRSDDPGRDQVDHAGRSDEVSHRFGTRWRRFLAGWQQARRDRGLAGVVRPLLRCVDGDRRGDQGAGHLGHRRRAWEQQCVRGHAVPAQHRPGCGARPGLDRSHRRGDCQGGTRHRRRMGVRPDARCCTECPLGPHLRKLFQRRSAGARVCARLRRGAAGRLWRPQRDGDRQAFHR